LIIPLILSPVFPDFFRTIFLYVEPITIHTHALIFLKSFVVAASWILSFFALKHLPISIVTPIRASAPAWTLLGALIIFSERLSTGHWIGYIIIFTSYYLFSITGKKEGINFRNNPWIFAIFGGTLLGAVSSLYDKYLMQRFDAVTVQAWFQVYLVIIIGLVVLVFWWPRRKSSTPFEFRFAIPLIGITLVIADRLYFHALNFEDALISLLSVVRRTSVIVSFTIGALLFNEVNKRKKGICLLGIFIGVLFIVFSTGK
jgi:transporter family protein